MKTIEVFLKPSMWPTHSDLLDLKSIHTQCGIILWKTDNGQGCELTVSIITTSERGPDKCARL